MFAQHILRLGAETEEWARLGPVPMSDERSLATFPSAAEGTHDATSGAVSFVLAVLQRCDARL